VEIFKTYSPGEFEKVALALFRKQSGDVEIYRNYIEALGVNHQKVNRLEAIPFLPVELFKQHAVLPAGIDPDFTLRFESSGTTGFAQSKHYVSNPEVYHQSCLNGFKLFYGEPSQYRILALLPSYLEKGHSSLVYMVRYLMDQSGYSDHGFFLYEHEELLERLSLPASDGRKTLLIGVSYALLELAGKIRETFPELIVMETGGMKGHGRELLREELHNRLKEAFGVPAIHSEYGMTELLSQAWSKGEGIYRTPPWMHIMIRNAWDPFYYEPDGQSGIIHIVDLANCNSCSFIATSDLGRKNRDGSFEVLGRADNSDLRGCNLLVN